MQTPDRRAIGALGATVLGALALPILAHRYFESIPLNPGPFDRRVCELLGNPMQLLTADNCFYACNLPPSVETASTALAFTTCIVGLAYVTGRRRTPRCS